MDRRQNILWGADTGNQLSDPLTRTPVMVMEAKTVGSPPASGMEQTVDGGEPDKLIMGLAAEEFEWQDRLRLVPIAVSTGVAFMLALKPDMVRIELGGFEYSASKVLIGLDGGRSRVTGHTGPLSIRH